jgi:transcriptional regulator with XRE-family HTH domain
VLTPEARDAADARYAAALATNLKTAITTAGTHSRKLAADSGVARGTITRILAAQTPLPSARSIAALEDTLGQTIWPDGPRPLESMPTDN